MTALQDHKELKLHTIDNTPLVGTTFKTDFKHLENYHHYEIFVYVPENFDKPGATYATIKGKRLMKIASKGGFQTQGYAFQNMVQRISELLEKARK